MHIIPMWDISLMDPLTLFSSKILGLYCCRNDLTCNNASSKPHQPDPNLIACVLSSLSPLKSSGSQMEILVLSQQNKQGKNEQTQPREEGEGKEKTQLLPQWNTNRIKTPLKVSIHAYSVFCAFSSCGDRPPVGGCLAPPSGQRGEWPAGRGHCPNPAKNRRRNCCPYAQIIDTADSIRGD